MKKKKIKTLDIVFMVLLSISMIINFVTFLFPYSFITIVAGIISGIIGMVSLLYLLIFRC